MLATGGGDAVINLWYDSTASDKEEAFQKEVDFSASVLLNTNCINMLKSLYSIGFLAIQ